MSARIASAILAELKRQADAPGTRTLYLYQEDEKGISVDGYVDIAALAEVIDALPRVVDPEEVWRIGYAATWMNKEGQKVYVKGASLANSVKLIHWWNLDTGHNGHTEVVAFAKTLDHFLESA